MLSSPLAAVAALLLAAPPAAAPLATPAEGRERVVVVGGDRAYPPYEFLDAQGAPAGFNVDLTRAIAEVMGMKVRFRFGDWAEMRAALRTGEVDVLEGISYSDARTASLDFSSPTAIVHHAVFGRKGAPRVGSLDALRGKKVVVFGGGILDEALSARGFGPDLVRTGSPADAMRLLASGGGDYVAVAALPGTWIAREYGLSNVEAVSPSVAEERYGFAVRKGDAALLARFDEGLAILKETGRYGAIHQKWLGVLEPQGVRWETAAGWAAVVLVPLLAGLGAVVLWSRSLARRVAQRTASLAREVAERKRAVEELRANQAKLVQADKMAALGVLASGVAHEINNPNGLILLHLPMLKAAVADALTALDARGGTEGLTLGGLPYARMRGELPQALEELHASGRRIKHIVEDLKDYARRDDAPPLADVDLNASARAAVRLATGALRRARFELALAPALPAVRGSARRLEQVVVNLLVNAAEALPPQGGEVRLATRAEGRLVVLEVRDTGEGIPPEHLAHIEEPFFTTKRDRGGTGLGLSVSAAIVKEHGGTLSFDSAPGAGTTARLVLPAAGEEAAA